MRRTWQQTIILAVTFLVLWLGVSNAHAYHTGSTFDRAPGGGGGGGLFYAGSPLERGWDCTLCHTNTPQQLRVSLISEPPDLIQDGRFVSGETYQITIRMLNTDQQLGLAATRSNYNSMVAIILDNEDIGSGSIGSFDPQKFFARGQSILASDSTDVNETEWSFSWTAPTTPVPEPVTLYFAVVDGNGANSSGVETRTDPLGDDIAIASFPVYSTAFSEAKLSVDRARLGEFIVSFAIAVVNYVETLRGA